MGVAQTKPDPRRYFEAVGEARGPIAEQEPVCLYIETTNRCNLLCETCPRTFEDLEPPADMSWALFTHIVDQFPNIARVVLHGVGEPMMVKALPRMIRYLKERGAYVLFNTNGTLLTERKGRELIAVGLDELRVSLDAAAPRAFLAVRGKNMFARIVRNVRAFTALQRAEGIDRPLVSLWLTGLKETVDQLPAFRTARGRRAHAARGGRPPCRDARGLLQCLGRRRTRHEPQAFDRRPAVVALPPALDVDVFYRTWKSDPVLHRAFFNAGL